MILMKGILLAATLTAAIAGVVYVYKLAEDKPDKDRDEPGSDIENGWEDDNHIYY